MENAEGAVEEVMQGLEKDWKSVTEQDVLCKINTENLDFSRDQEHKLVNALPRIRELQRLLNSGALGSLSQVGDPVCMARVPRTLDIDFGAHARKLKDVSSADRVTALYDAEEAILAAWNATNLSRQRLLELHDLMTSYVSVSDRAYSGDPEGQSRRVLMATAMALIADREACKEFPLLEEYQVGIDMSMLEVLLVPHLWQKILLRDMESHVRSRDSVALRPSTLTPAASQTSFAVRFAEQSSDMEKVREEILQKCSKNQQQKTKEVKEKQHQFDSLRKQAAKHEASSKSLLCKCSDSMPGASPCERCKLAKKAGALCSQAGQIKVDFYEKLLPERLHEQRAVVYELRQPRVLALQRDLKLLVARDLAVENFHSNQPVMGFWRDDPCLSEWQSCNATFSLASTTKKFCQSHYRSLQVSKHDTFVVPHGYNLALGDRRRNRTITSKLHWDVAELTKAKPDDVRYDALSEQVASWKTDENMGIAKQSEAHPDLSLLEFLTYSALRSGIHLQLPRLADAIAQHILSFDRTGVLNLLKALLWQAGPPADDSDPRLQALRNARRVLLQEDFAMVLCNQFSGLLSRAAQSRELLCIVHVARCLVEHSALRAAEAAAGLLVGARKQGLEWLQEETQLLRESSGSGNASEIEDRRNKIVDIAAACALTFLPSSTEPALPELMISKASLSDWLHFRAVCHDNILLGCRQQELVDPERWCLLQQAMRQALSIEEDIHSIGPSPQLTAFVKSHWSGGRDGTYDDWQRCEMPAGCWYRSRFDSDGHSCVLHVHVLDGSFLVDGQPVGCLPKEITDSDVYRQLFGNSVLEVQLGVDGGYMTNALHHGGVFGFKLDSKVGVVITEDRQRDDGSWVQAALVPRDAFRHDVPGDLVDGHSHWLVDSEAAVYFRPMRANDPTFAAGCTECGAKYILDLKGQTVRNTTTNACMIDIQSNTFQELFERTFRRIAPQDRVHVYAGDPAPMIFLPSLRLRFYVCQKDGDAQIRCHELGGTVAEDQSLGTLVGLEHGLALETKHTKSLLLPHAAVTRCSSGSHCEVTLDLASLGSPPFFVYSVRPELHELCGQKDRQAWLYLALLHAKTSGVLPDPFTGRTGTATALQLLRSPRCRGNLRDSLEDKIEIGTPEKTLHEIALLSPKRSRYPAHICVMEQVDFGGMPGLCAHEGFSFLAHEALREVAEQSRVTGEAAEGLHDEQVFGKRCGLLSQRAYLRNREEYGFALSLSCEEEQALEIQHPLTTKQWQEEDGDREPVRRIALAARSGTFPQDLLLQSFLLASAKIDGVVDNNLAMASVPEWEEFGKHGDNMRGSWIALYQAAIAPDSTSRFVFFLTYLAVQWPQHVKHLELLAGISFHADKFRALPLPSHREYECPDEFEFRQDRVQGMIEELQELPEPRPLELMSSSEEKFKKEVTDYEQRLERFFRQREEDRQRVIDASRSKWGSEGSVTREECSGQTVRDPAWLMQRINAYLIRCRQARELRDFVISVEAQASQMATPAPLCWDVSMHRNRPELCLSPPFELSSPSQLELAPDNTLDAIWFTGRFPQPVTYEPDGQVGRGQELQLAPDKEYEAINESLVVPLKESWELAKTRVVDLQPQFPSDLRKRLCDYQVRARLTRKMAWHQIRHALDGRGSSDVLMQRSGLYDTPVPLTVLPRLLDKKDDAPARSLRTAIGTYAVCLRAEQRANRCLRLHDADGMGAWLARELQPSSTGSSNWEPEEHPEWLLFEIDNDVCIREEQVLVAQKMMSGGSEADNCLVQLNMGEGKTSVIVPLLIAALADKCNLLCITVLSSLRHSNAADWQLKLGGLLGHRIYPLFCRRDLKMEAAEASALYKLLDNIRLRGHVVVTVPEHRLSLENKALELAKTGNLLASQQLHDVLSLMKEHKRDVLDESDEILHPKNQLIYTLGSQQDLDGERLRWRLASAVLARVAWRAEELARMFGSDEVEYVPGTPDFEFPSFRLLQSAARQADQRSAYHQLCEWIVEDLIAEDTHLHLQLRGAELEAFKESALSPASTDKPWLRLDPSLQPVAYMLRGLLCHDILLLALSKRWRVEYGVHPGGRRRMAVPYRAKDVATDRTDFGHPDVAIVLSVLTYYRGGLDDKAMEEVFERLHHKGGRRAEAIYSEWTSQMGDKMPTGLRRLSGVNQDSQKTMQALYSVLRKHRGVIDFWLDEVVFQVEAKQFPQKLVATAWDLCPKGPLTTGFSGTDDAKPLLPTTIQQSNLPELAHTNGLVLRNMLREENDYYTALEADDAGREILQRMISSEQTFDVLLDAGALVTDMTNQQLASEWLQKEKRRGKEAAIFFSNQNTEMVVDRNGQVLPLSLSPYERSLDKCLLYLDDVHCRGCDFSMPPGSRAAVTLGRGMQKDKFVQACMRMRLLGNGHCLSLLASYEVNLQVKQYQCKPELKDMHVLCSILSWCVTNTAKVIADKLPYMASQGASRMRKEAAYAGSSDLTIVAEGCCEDEARLLKEMYGHGRTKQALPDIVRKILNTSQQPETGVGVRPCPIKADIEVRVRRLASGVQRHRQASWMKNRSGSWRWSRRKNSKWSGPAVHGPASRRSRKASWNSRSVVTRPSNSVRSTNF
ncbi:unnamed protein product [Symbiodinium sp. CCMP2592]|nr:unnamed protein product [Symbiodinium sp. CCMP2592]